MTILPSLLFLICLTFSGICERYSPENCEDDRDLVSEVPDQLRGLLRPRSQEAISICRSNAFRRSSSKSATPPARNLARSLTRCMGPSRSRIYRTSIFFVFFCRCFLQRSDVMKSTNQAVLRIQTILCRIRITDLVFKIPNTNPA